MPTNNLPTLTTDNLITAQPGTITFDDTDLLEQATFIAKQLDKMEVTEENLKESKKLVARVSKAVKELNDERIRVKNLMLEPYNDLKDRIDTISNIVKSAENRVRSIAKEFDEKEREEKREKVEEMFNALREQYDLWVITFDQFLKPRHLNKTQTDNKNHAEIVTFFEGIKSDLSIIERFGDDKVEIMTEYMDTLDLNLAIETVEKRNETRQKVESVVTPTEKVDDKVTILLDRSDLKFVKLLLKDNGIDFEVVD